MGRTNSWVNTVPLDHTKFKSQPGHVRDVRIDIEDRLSSILYGFATSLETEDFNALKMLPFMDWATPSTPSGTGSAATHILFGSSWGGEVEVFGINSGANVFPITSGGSLAGVLLPGGGVALTANWDVGAYAITALRFISDQATGTAPLTVASTTVVTNLNADLLDGIHMSAAAGANKIYQSGADNYLPDDTVDTTALKTAQGAVSSTGEAATMETLPGGEYGFFIQTKSSNTGGIDEMSIAKGMALTTSYVTRIQINANAGQTLYAQQRYMTASGTDHFIFVKIDKITKGIMSCYEAPDHPSYGNGGNYEKVPHPFQGYDESKYEIILLDQATCKQLKQESEATIQGEGEPPERCILTILNEDYKPDMAKKEPYVPLHSGKYKKTLENGKEVVTKHMIKTIPNYISVRKLTKLTQAEKDERKAKQEAQRIENEQKKQAKENARASAKNKFKVGAPLNQEEIEALFD